MANHEFDAPLFGILLIPGWATRIEGRFQTVVYIQCYLLNHFISPIAHAVCRAHDPDLIPLLTGFLVMGSVFLMVPASVWVRVGANRINELMVLVNRLSLPTKSLTTSPTSVSSGHFRSQ